jgi:cobalt-zinc-cadmium efflux system membrane fusion protein
VRRVAVAGLALLCAACGDAASAPLEAPHSGTAAAPDAGVITVPVGAEQIRTGAVESADVPLDEVAAPARVGIDPNRVSRVLLPVAGRIAEVMARLGDRVEQGQGVVTVESPDADAAVGAARQAEAAERQAAAALIKAEADAARVKDLLEHGAAAQKDLLAASNDRAQALAGVETARAAREQALRRIELLGLRPFAFGQRVTVRAPIEGTVLELSVAPGEYRTDTAASLMTVADLSRVWVSAEVAEPAIGSIRVGDSVAITLVAFAGQEFTGRVTRIADVVDPQTRTVKVHVQLANPTGRLRPDMFGSMRHAGAARRVPVLPLAAVVREYGRSMVFVERAPGRFARREVELGARAGNRVAVLSGVSVGEQVVVDGAVLLKDR